MLDVEADRLLKTAAEKTLRRIARDRERASAQVAPLLDYVAEHLFDPELRYERMRRACEIRDNNRSTLFRHDVGLTPAVYVRDCRFEVASRLLRDTDLAAARVGELVGYRGPNVFGAAFRRWCGQTPGQYRHRERVLAGRGDLSAGVDLPDLSPAVWRRFVEGDLTDADAERLLRFLLDLYPNARSHLLRELLRLVAGKPTPHGEPVLAPTLRSLLAREDIERLMAELVWEDLHARPLQEQRDAVRHHLRFTTPALVDLLLTESAQARDAHDAAAAHAVASLALDAARAVVDETSAPQLEARAASWVEELVGSGAL